MKLEFIVCFVVSGMAVEVRKSIWSTFETALAQSPLFSSGFHPLLASPGERWFGREVTCLQTRDEACDQGDTGCLFSTGADCVTVVMQNPAQASSETWDAKWCWPLISCSQPVPGTWVGSVPSPLSFFCSNGCSYPHSFCTHLVKDFSRASGALVNQHRPKGQKAHGSWNCFHFHSGSSYTVVLCFGLLSSAPFQRQIGRK